ncbi:MAG: tRNA (guanosine(46)-N7)-methyltransferase TrmB, partial [Thiogranum sp.]|nr:tRNA (guanosine(46)-N7)-methyltransferase TrmB [Thiogranum sp.]
FHMATDWQPYADQMLDVMQASAEFINCSATGTWSERPPYRPVTKFEARGKRLGHGVWDLVYRRR